MSLQSAHEPFNALESPVQALQEARLPNALTLNLNGAQLSANFKTLCRLMASIEGTTLCQSH